MAQQALYRKWRAQDFDEIIGQPNIVRTLRHAVRDNRVAHAYLFAGPRGTGKTSTARILAKAVNCLSDSENKPCNECALCKSITEGRCLDLIEIDAASNRGIDEIRELRERVNFAPSEGTYKIYLIDEVHMLTNEAFNALLKTLEEPPEHVIFILATTEAYRLPATILSRCQRFDFRHVSLQDLLKKLNKICAAENIDIESAALEMIARQATGSFRDAESLLDQLAASGERISFDYVQSVLGAASSQAVGELVDYVIARDLSGGLNLINRVVEEGIDPRQFNLELLEYLRGLLLLKSDDSGELLRNVTEEILAKMQQQAPKLPLPRLVKIVNLFNDALTQRRSQKAGGVLLQLPLEVAFTATTLPDEPVPVVAVAPQTVREAPTAKVAAAPVPPRPSAPPPPVAKPTPAPPPPEPTVTVAEPLAPVEGEITMADIHARWTSFMNTLKSYDARVEAFMKDCSAEDIAGNKVILLFKHKFHYSQISKADNKELVERVLADVLGQPCTVECVTKMPKNTEKSPNDDAGDPLLKDPLIKMAVEELGAEAQLVEDDSVVP